MSRRRLALDTPLNIHLTGCHHSCAQHYIGDIGMLAVKVPKGDDGDPVEGFSIYVGGGSGPDARLGRELWPNVEAERCPRPSRSCWRPTSNIARRRRRRSSSSPRRHQIESLKLLAGDSAP